ncbi:MAG: hypothetical protein IJY62_05820 [Clostridia bacterium]|nr:hypothetical protein [Clostridia bacterium]
MKESKLNFNRYTNCLRVQIYPDERFMEHAEDIRDYCLKNDIGNVIVFMFAEAFFDGHSTKADFEPWVEKIKLAKKLFNDAGISFSLNPWMEVGHVDRGRTLKEGQNFTLMTDMDGLRSTLQVCPYCEEWRKYFADVQAYYTGELAPDVLWIEDDFRLHNHAPLNYGGCYCDIHMRKFNEKLGTAYTREQLLEKIFAKGKPTAERKAWLDVNRDTILSLAEFAGKNIAKSSPKTEVGLMSSSIVSHTFEARDWKGVCEGLAQGKRIINRIHLPAYNENVPAYYYRAFNMTSMLVRRMLPDDAKIYPELESGDYNNYVRDPEFLRFQVESAIPLILSGMTYNILDVVGNGAFDVAGYGEAIKNITPYLRAVTDLKLKYSSLEGVVIPFDPNCAYKREIRERGWRDLYPYHLDFAGYLSGLGCTYKVALDKALKGEFVCLIGGSADDFTDREMEALFENNFVLVDAGAAERLFERGLGRLIAAKALERIPTNQGKTAYEQAGDWLEVDGHHGLRVSSEGGMWSTGDYLKIDYSREVNVLSDVYDNHNRHVGKGSVLETGFAVIPYYMEAAPYEHYNEVRRRIVFKMLKERAKTYVLTQSSCVYPYLFKEENRCVVMLVNTMFKPLDKMCLELKGVAFKQVEIVGKDGMIRPVAFAFDGKTLEIKEPLGHMSTATIILK